MVRKPTIGIYTITNPEGKVYIGQSWNVEKRWNAHKAGAKHCLKLIDSFMQFGYSSHKFEYCHLLPDDICQLTMNAYEQLYMDVYRAAGIELLNLREGGGRGKHSEESRQKMCIAQRGKPVSDIARQRMSAARTGMKIPPEIVEKSRLTRIGKKMPPEGVLKSALARTGAKRTDEARLKMSLAQKNKNWTQVRREAQNKKACGLL
jgi:group I intron endonuclease